MEAIRLPPDLSSMKRIAGRQRHLEAATSGRDRD